MLFLGIWVLVVYAPLAHMVWGGEGSLIGEQIGALDFAGGDVVHIFLRPHPVWCFASHWAAVAVSVS